MSDAARTTVFYDGGCPVCAREMAVYQAARGAEAVRFVDVMREPAPEGVSRKEALARLHVRRADGSLAVGAAGFAALWSSLPGWRTLGRVAALPFVLPVLELGYRGFLRVRRAWRSNEP
jgi:predicted DCC family thiol-disulfide oxidoreductase YuxK